MEEKTLLSTREIARFLNINEKMVYTLIAEKGLPATKATGKWLFPRHLVEQWLENQTINYPKTADPLPPYHGLLIISGSNDILLDKALSLFNRLYPENVAVFGNLGSLGGLRALRRNLCHIASSHLLQENDQEYNFGFAKEELGQMPGVVNFCKREQGLLVGKGNPKKIEGVPDLGRKGIRIVNRQLGTGTRLLLDGELTKAGIEGERIQGYDREVTRHFDVGLEVLSGRADAGPGIRAVAGLLDLDFISLRWERFDFLIQKDRFFERGVQLFLGLLSEPAFRELVKDLEGYDLDLCGKMVFPIEATEERR
ncbi:MAG: helix-turn-helix transcriptional regulator [Desulfobacterales bacterium]|nr:helix-turn-helix transcriptional regulator [Desulfobacterales bacterium]MBL7173493.1 helix-turn-helix transcriptional regulator [Desulfobacteraceae bacterium]MBU0734119.1 helix-turn-helix transcriptional regulator [Pseudomonadota bacterium]MBU0989791.1 helix-turn-helix transcriptional regulator [Pseudomonadota bacterium]